MPLKACRDFCRRFGIGHRAGADLLRLLDSEAKHGSPRQRAAMEALRAEAARGTALADGMNQNSHFFPPLLRSMVKVGEATGRLERTLLKLADHYEQQVRLKNDFVRAITWPSIQLILGIGVISLLIWIMGNVTPSAGGEMMDLLGLGLRGSSGVLVFWAYIAGFFAIVLAAITAFQKNIGGVQNTIPLLYKIPVIGNAIQTITLSRFTWTLALALDAGLNPIAAIKLALDATDSDYYRSGAEDAENNIRAGGTLTDALQATSLFPDEFLTQVGVAEISGTDSETIDYVARDYDERAKAAMKTISGVATGVVWLGVAGAILFVIFRIVMSIAGVYNEALQGI
ncbi:Type II secretion system protein F [Neorhodopirellula pilleata]|uniref:Type II secretion system protein F n=2 Tax=Neorhodopirellula pilleata TaxID=2714738 RepID=A0A5C6ADN6_9BACT|nr:Type II secretion system protein F [Neorhodopirellula pilleata]